MQSHVNLSQIQSNHFENKWLHSTHSSPCAGPQALSHGNVGINLRMNGRKVPGLIAVSIAFLLIIFLIKKKRCCIHIASCTPLVKKESKRVLLSSMLLIDHKPRPQKSKGSKVLVFFLHSDQRLPGI